MKNLKRALSLVLSAAMMVGMMVVGTGAAYTDVTAEHNEEAIAVMEAAGIMEGDGKGFNPDNKVTRHEMAVVMANLLDLKVEDFNGAETPFTDVAAWAAPYVAACYADGIMAGTSATTFGGTINVTAAQAALMMMKALGYFQFQPDFGEDWQLATIKQASKIDLFDGMDVGATTELTRNDVAQLALNALESDMVDYEGSQGTNITLSDGTSILTGYTIKYNPIVERGSDDYTQGTATPDDAYTQLVEELFGNDLKKFGATDDFGRSATEWKFKTEGLGKFAKAADATYTNKVTKATMYSLVGKDVVDDLADALVPAAVLTVYVDGAPVSSPAVTDYFVKNNTASIGATALTGNASSVEVYVDSDTNSVNIVIVNTYLVKADADYSAKRESVNVTMKSSNAPVLNSSTLKGEDFDVENVAKDDYLLITACKNGTNYDVKSVAPATVLTGEVGTYKNGDNVTIDGTAYKYAFKACDDGSVNAKTVAYTVGEETKVITDGTFIYYVDEASVAADKYVFVKDIAGKGNFANADLQAQGIFLDGTSKVIDIKDKYSDKSAVVTGVAGAGWYAYTVNSDEIYTLVKLGTTVAGTTTAGTKLTDANTTLIANGSGVKANAKTIFVVVDEDDDITVYTGINEVPTIYAGAATKNAIVTNTAGTIAKYVFIDADNGAIDAAKDSEDFIYVLKADGSGVDANKDSVYYYKAIVNGEETTITTTATYTVDALYTDVKYDEAGYVDSMNVVDATDDYVVAGSPASAQIAYTSATIGYEGGVLTIGSTDFVVDSDLEIFMIARDANIKADGAANYELTTGISADALKSILNGYTATGYYFAQCDEDTAALTALYIVLTATV